MLNMILLALGLCFLCWCYTRLQMYVWYGPHTAGASRAGETSESPFAIKPSPMIAAQDEEIESSSHCDDLSQFSCTMKEH